MQVNMEIWKRGQIIAFILTTYKPYNNQAIHNKKVYTGSLSS